MVSAVTDSRSRNEQYQGLELAWICRQRLSPAERKEIRDAIKRANIEPGTDRWQLAQKMLNLSDS
jgi:hypothetical protein